MTTEYVIYDIQDKKYFTKNNNYADDKFSHWTEYIDDADFFLEEKQAIEFLESEKFKCRAEDDLQLEPVLIWIDEFPYLEIKKIIKF